MARENDQPRCFLTVQENVTVTRWIFRVSYRAGKEEHFGLPLSGYQLRIAKGPIVSGKGLLHELVADKISGVIARSSHGHFDLFERLEHGDVVVAPYEQVMNFVGEARLQEPDRQNAALPV